MKHFISKTLVAAILVFASTGKIQSAPLSFDSILSTAKAIVTNFQRPTTTINLANILNRSCLASALYHEARGEPVEGQIAVGITIFNRMISSAYPSTICGVVFQNSHRYNKCQFSFACDGRSDQPRNQVVFNTMRQLSVEILSMMNLSANIKKPVSIKLSPMIASAFLATHYHRYDVSPSWSKKLPVVARVGDHVFFQSERVLKRIPKKIRRTHANFQSVITASYENL